MRDKIKGFLRKLRSWHWLLGSGALVIVASIVIDPMAGIASILGFVLAGAGYLEWVDDSARGPDGERDTFQG